MVINRSMIVNIKGKGGTGEKRWTLGSVEG